MNLTTGWRSLSFTVQCIEHLVIEIQLTISGEYQIWTSAKSTMYHGYIIVTIVVQKILNLDLFPDSVFETELKYYLAKMNEVD